MELRLADGWFAAQTCGERIGLSYLITVILLGTLAVLSYLFMEFAARKRMIPIATLVGHSTPLPSDDVIDRDPKAGAINAVLVSFVAAVILLGSLVAPLSRSRTHVFATETSIVETGCQLFSAYQEVLDRDKASVTYRSRVGGKDNHRMNWLEIRQKGKRSISISLDKTPYLNNLTEVAPLAMSQYFEQIRDR